mmetsp:Transcript_22522/g.45621  ORF Transcript_22522/g.45621 Transcript_22522/m.45621 type:complete len:372 (+) Transcript_22522:1541-2656(+)
MVLFLARINWSSGGWFVFFVGVFDGIVIVLLDVVVVSVVVVVVVSRSVCVVDIHEGNVHIDCCRHSGNGIICLRIGRGGTGPRLGALGSFGNGMRCHRNRSFRTSRKGSESDGFFVIVILRWGQSVVLCGSGSSHGRRLRILFVLAIPDFLLILVFIITLGINILLFLLDRIPLSGQSTQESRTLLLPVHHVPIGYGPSQPSSAGSTSSKQCESAWSPSATKRRSVIARFLDDDTSRKNRLASILGFSKFRIVSFTAAAGVVVVVVVVDFAFRALVIRTTRSPQIDVLEILLLLRTQIQIPRRRIHSHTSAHTRHADTATASGNDVGSGSTPTVLKHGPSIQKMRVLKRLFVEGDFAHGGILAIVVVAEIA